MKPVAEEVAGTSSPAAEEGMDTVAAAEEEDAELSKDHRNAGKTMQTNCNLHADNWNSENPNSENTDFRAVEVDVVVEVVVVVEQGFDWVAEGTTTGAGMAYTTPWERKIRNFLGG